MIFLVHLLKNQTPILKIVGFLLVLFFFSYLLVIVSNINKKLSIHIKY